MSQRALVYELGARASRHRDVAARIQRGTAEERPRRAHARRLRKTADKGNEYSHRRALKGTATQDGGTSMPYKTCGGWRYHMVFTKVHAGGIFALFRSPSVERCPIDFTSA